MTFSDDRTRDVINRAMKLLGVRPTARLIGVSPNTLYALTRGSRVHPGTWALMRERAPDLLRRIGG